MREIKFRGYSKEKLIGSQWITNGYGVSKINYTDGTSSVHLLSPYGDYLVEEDSIGQYTGLKDKNGKEICEGDIIKYSHSIVGTIIREVRIKYGMWGIEGMTKGTQIPFANLLENEYEVIGNKFENPELLG
ncbi:YopX family protein [Romboutsia sp. Marseille-P6047]|uniref:YopX family protein n=1 Tax=Romboutsia sp. Marseille-P6047 TaxID=2161817 RepID=UPI000F052676|nr:YopX family protein [Romboutsia sp. Marseille-P6047]